MLSATFRSEAEATVCLHAGLDQGPWLLVERYSAADLLLHSPYAFFPDWTPDDPLIRNWVERCMARLVREQVVADDAARMAQAVAA